MIEAVINEFGEGFGLTGLTLNEAGNVDLEIGESDRLQLQLVDQALLLCFAVSHYERDALPFMERLLAVCHPDNDHPYALQVGFVGQDQVMLILRLDAREVNADILMAAFDFLWDIRQSYLS
jgi:type III secretion system chaperone SycN